MEGVDHLAHERNSAQFDVDEMKIVWAGSRHAFEVSDRMSRLVANDPVSNFYSTVQNFQTLYSLYSNFGMRKFCNSFDGFVLGSRSFERTTGSNYQGRSCLKTLSEKQLTHGRGLLSLNFLVWLFDSSSLFGKPWIVLYCIVLLIFFHIYFTLCCYFLTEEEAGRLRFFVDEPAYTDLHWVS